MPTTASSSAAAPPRSHGLGAALRSLASPLHFTPRAPSLSAVPFAAPRPGVPARADVYLPDEVAHGVAPGTPGVPSVVLVHGGGFMIGSRTMKPMRLLGTRLAEAGIAVAIIDYRLIGRGGALTEAVDDVVTAFRWWQQFGPQFGADPARMSLMGLSAGGTLALLAAAQLATAEALHRVVDVFGVTDFAALRGNRAALMRRLVLAGDDPVARSPVRHQAALRQPMLIVHGTSDSLVPHAHAEALADARAAQGLPTELVLLDGAPHGFFNTAETSDDAEAALATIVPFLRG
jgi:acetyl esterase/lipase